MIVKTTVFALGDLTDVFGTRAATGTGDQEDGYGVSAAGLNCLKKCLR